MLNVTQRLIVGCVLLACLTVALVAVAHKALAAAGQLHFAYIIILAALVIETATVFFVLRPLNTLARDAQRTPQAIGRARTVPVNTHCQRLPARNAIIRRRNRNANSSERNAQKIRTRKYVVMMAAPTPDGPLPIPLGEARSCKYIAMVRKNPPQIHEAR